MNRKYQLDILRVVACLFVLFYHYFYFGPLTGQVAYPAYTSVVFNYGYLGVDIFFIISGFVIFNSLGSYDYAGFFKARIQRLYPTYWICMCFTVFFFFMFGKSFNLFDFFINLTMFQSFLSVKNIDGVYWTLTIEIVFYVIMAFSYYIFSKRYFDFFIVSWLLIAYLSFFELYDFGLFKSLFLLNWIPYFLVGLIMFRVLNDRHGKFWLSIALFFAVLLSMMRTYQRSIALSLMDGANIIPIYASFIVFFVFVILLFSLIFNFNLNKKSTFLMKLSLSTYPLYLLHQEIGYFLINYLERQVSGLAVFFIIPITVVFVLALAQLVVFIEKRINNYCTGVTFRKIFR